MLILFLLGITYIVLTLFIFNRIRLIMIDNKNYIGKLFYIFKFLLTTLRSAGSIFIIE